MQLDLKKLEEFKASFLECFPDGQSFDDPEYLASERNYKDELVDAFKSSVSQHFPVLPAPDEIAQLVGALQLVGSPFGHVMKDIDDD